MASRIARDSVELSDAELVTKLAETKEELFNLRFQIATGQLDNNARMRTLRKDVARINMLLRAREIAAAEASSPRGEEVTSMSETTTDRHLQPTLRPHRGASRAPAPTGARSARASWPAPR